MCSKEGGVHQGGWRNASEGSSTGGTPHPRDQRAGKKVCNPPPQPHAGRTPLFFWALPPCDQRQQRIPFSRWVSYWLSASAAVPVLCFINSGGRKGDKEREKLLRKFYPVILIKTLDFHCKTAFFFLKATTFNKSNIFNKLIKYFIPSCTKYFWVHKVIFFLQIKSLFGFYFSSSQFPKKILPSSRL